MPGRSGAARRAATDTLCGMTGARVRRAGTIVMLALVAAACGADRLDPSDGAAFQLRPVLDHVSSASPDADPTAVTCDAAGDGVAACLAEHASESVVAPGTSDADTYVLGPVVVDGRDVADAQALDEERSNAGWSVLVQLTPEGTEALAAATGDAIGDRIAMLIHGRVVSAPTVEARIGSGNVIVAAGFSQTQAKALAERLGGG